MNYTFDDGAAPNAFREMGLPVTLFGEGPYERRERLKQETARLESIGALPPTNLMTARERLLQEESGAQKQQFFTQGLIVGATNCLLVDHMTYSFARFTSSTLHRFLLFFVLLYGLDTQPMGDGITWSVVMTSLCSFNRLIVGNLASSG